MPEAFRAAVITASDRGAAGLRPIDASGDKLAELLGAADYQVVERHLLPDDRGGIAALLARLADGGGVDLILTTGGTGLSPRDVTPEATLAVAERLVPGLAEAMRAASLAKTPMAMLSRAVAAVRGRTLIVNLPGSPKAVAECWEVIAPVLPHGLALLTDGGRGQHGESHTS